MTDYRLEPSIGTRIKAARKARGFRTTRDLAEAMQGSKIKSWTLDNIESGRKAELEVSQLLNISIALGLPPSYLLATIGRPNAGLDLPNLSDRFSAMTVAEFDSWLSATRTSAYRAPTSAERIDIDELHILRELSTLQREIIRLEIVASVEADADDPGLNSAVPETRRRIDRIKADIRQLEVHLSSSGWDLSE